MLIATASGAGSGSFNDDYVESGTLNSKKRFQAAFGATEWDGTQWVIIGFPGDSTRYYNTNDTTLVPQTGWEVGTGAAPAPTFSGDGSEAIGGSAPAITSFTPTTGTTGTIVTITGTGFTGTTAVEFFYASTLEETGQYNEWDFTVDSDTQITATATDLPEGESAPTYFGAIRVTTPGGNDETTPPPNFQFTPMAVNNAKGFFALM